MTTKELAELVLARAPAAPAGPAVPAGPVVPVSPVSPFGLSGPCGPTANMVEAPTATALEAKMAITITAINLLIVIVKATIYSPPETQYYSKLFLTLLLATKHVSDINLSLF
jgi:hypothetical protein